MKFGRVVQVPLYITIGLIIVFVFIFSNKISMFQSPFSFTKITTSSSSTTSTTFVTRSDSSLMLDESPFRFASSNMHWLGLDDTATYPSQFRVNDGFDAAKEMGATVVRAHNLGISTGCSNCIEPSLGVFNKTAFLHNDYVIKAARDHGLRLIIPLTDNWHYATGGKHTFTDWRGLSNENLFYTNVQVIKDFEVYITSLLNHVNSYTGVAYKNDPTILAWETGNELDPPTSWTQTISTYIKSTDNNHLVVDGKEGVDTNARSLSNVDIVSDHYYPMNIARLTRDANTAKRTGKAFFVGEFDWNNANGGDALQRFLATIESNSAIAGDAFWELWSHNDQYGYASNQIQYTLHYPGDSAIMRASVKLLRIHAYNMRKVSVPAEGPPGVPLLNVVIRGDHNNTLVWRGAPLAANYTVERATSGANGPWKVVCNKCATDSSTPWTDTTTPTGSLWYRVIAYNLSGVASKASDPYHAESAGRLSDDLDNWSKTYAHSNNLAFNTTNAQYMHNDTSVIARTTSTHENIMWRHPGIVSFQATTYFWPHEAVSPFSLYTSTDGKTWTLSKPEITIINGNWPEYIYTLNGLPKVNYIKMVWNNTRGRPWNPTVGMVTISY